MDTDRGAAKVVRAKAAPLSGFCSAFRGLAGEIARSCAREERRIRPCAGSGSSSRGVVARRGRTSPAAAATRVSMDVDRRLERYDVPGFAARVRENAPEYRVRLAMTPTPVQRWRVDGVPEEFELLVKRDDMTGSTLGGNKVRKLEFLLADAIVRHATVIITCGGVQSNFCRAAAAAAKELGMEAHLFWRSATPEEPRSVGNQGNVLLAKLLGSRAHLVAKQPYEDGLLPKMRALAARLEREGETPYLMAVGGDGLRGLWGYIDAWGELQRQGVEERVDDVVMAIGSGSTALGVAVGGYLSGSRVRVHAVSVCDNAQYFHRRGNALLHELGLGGETTSESILHVIDGYKGRGYALSTPEELDFCRDVMRSSGVPVDPVYTGKALRGVVEEMKRQSRSGGEGAFSGRRVLFVHTGGIFGLYDGQIQGALGDAPVSTWEEP